MYLIGADFSTQICPNMQKSKKTNQPPLFSPSKSKTYKNCQYWHFNGNKTGVDSRVTNCKSKIKTIANKRSKQYDKALKYLGFGLHALQDKEAHGQIGKGKDIPEHITVNYNDYRHKADTNIGWEWKDAKRNSLKYVAGSAKRKNSTKTVTKNYLKRFSDAIWRKK